MLGSRYCYNVTEPLVGQLVLESNNSVYSYFIFCCIAPIVSMTIDLFEYTCMHTCMHCKNDLHVCVVLVHSADSLCQTEILKFFGGGGKGHGLKLGPGLYMYIPTCRSTTRHVGVGECNFVMFTLKRPSN